MMRLSLLLCLGLLNLAVANEPRTVDTQRVWVYFADKQLTGFARQQALDSCEQSLAPHARERRLRNQVALADEYDLPVSASYLEQVRACGVRIREVSKWLNAASCEATAAQISQLRALMCVRGVAEFRLRPEPREISEMRRARPATDVPNYGFSDWQNQLCGVPQLHARGLSGRGVLMCFLDTGCLLAHQAFDSLHVVAVRDFIFNDNNVADELGLDSSGQMLHGTATLSAAVGYRDSLLIGPAFGASVMIAKTEWIADEIRSEEDHYVAALEWADSAGADITSSSLGYIAWYTYNDLDGHTAVTTQAALIAARHGILVVSSAGNNRAQEWHYIGTPADADSIVAVGAVDSFRVLGDFSSGGPTADGRLKPEVCAMGVGVFSAFAQSDHDYWFLTGTSLSAPLVAGIAALLLEAHPEWSAQHLREALIMTASNSATPDNELGWGLVNAPLALDYDAAESHRATPKLPAAPALLRAFPNPVNGDVTLELELQQPMKGALVVYDLIGREIFASGGRDWAAGTTRVRIDASALASGELFARFATARETVVSRIVVVK
jgi:serine protease AprX